jgi:DNA-binding HxlR family transcriptional regulator
MSSSDKCSSPPYSEIDPKVEAMMHELLGRVADKWTLLVLEELEEQGTLRFTELSRRLPGVSQKMLTQTLRQMERDGLLHRTVHPVVPPKVEYRLTELGHGLSESFCGVWRWVEANLDAVESARQAFDARKSG